MPGIVGYVGTFDVGDPATDLIERMAKALEPESRFEKELQQDSGWGLGRASLRIVNPAPQPIWSEDRYLCAVMEGELFDYVALREELSHLFWHTGSQYSLPGP